MKELSKADEVKLKELNNAVTKAFYDRKQWKISKMEEYSLFEIGDEAWCFEKKCCIGHIRTIEIYKASFEQYDNEFSIYYTFEPLDGGCRFSSMDFHVGTKERVIEWTKEVAIEKLKEAQQLEKQL